VLFSTGKRVPSIMTPTYEISAFGFRKGEKNSHISFVVPGLNFILSLRIIYPSTSKEPSLP